MSGKRGIEWVMERRSITADKASGIVKEANAWAPETVGDARYPLSLMLLVISVSQEKLKIARALPAPDLLEGKVADDEGPARAGLGRDPCEFRDSHAA